jgi:hypothetical protein
MTGTFAEQLGKLRELTGAPGRIEAQVVVDQVYAHYQHEHVEFRHPVGGQAKYLEAPLMASYRDYLEDYARTVLSDGGHDAVKRSVEHLSDQVELLAPVEWADLRRSGHPSVSQAGRLLYDRPPKQARLTEEELRAKSRAIMRIRMAAGKTVYFMRHGKVMVIPGKNDLR